MMEADTTLGIHLLSLLWHGCSLAPCDRRAGNIDVEKVMGMALCHDMGEALTGDIGTAIKPAEWNVEELAFRCLSVSCRIPLGCSPCTRTTRR